MFASLARSLVSLSIALTAVSASGAELQGVRLPETTTLAGQTLQLNGMGLRTRFGFARVYVAGLYLSSRTSDGTAALAQAGPKRIAFVLKRDVEARTFAKALEDGVRERASAEQLAALKDRLDRFAISITQLKDVREGDIVFLDYVPALGTQLVHASQAVGAPIAGDDFYRAILDLYVGSRPVQDSLKNGMLGKSGG